MNVEVQVSLDKFSLRWYQEEIWDTIEQRKSKRVLYIASRRAGKDILFWNLAIRQCLKRICLVFYVLPSYAQGRKAIFDCITIEQIELLDYVPALLVEAINQSEMKIRFKNGSILQVIGGDTYDTSLVGTNPYAVILSEHQLMPPDIFSFIRPILAANGGWCGILGTPRGKNHFWHLYNVAKALPDTWKVFIHKASEIKHIPDEVLAQERAQMDEGLYLQEYECSFERGIVGSYYGTYLDALKLRGQIGYVPWEPGLITYTVWDIGVHDPTTILFFNVVGDGSVIRIIDCYSNNNLGLDHYAKILQDKPYVYSKHFAPFDINVREYSDGVSRYEKARQLGIQFTLIPQIGLIDGIENVWTHFNKLWIDAEKCKSFVDALENYRKQWDEKNQIYLPKPVERNWANHYADTLRYLCLSLRKTKRGMSSEDFDRKKAQALYGNQGELPRFFRDDPRYDSYR